jgi:iron complex transport system substrate-binding protein
MIAGIGWVSEIVEAAGGVDVFADRAQEKSARARVVSVGEVIAAAPDIIIGSWCGKRFRPERVRGRAGFEHIPAGQTWGAERSQVFDYSATGPGSAHRRARCHR